MTEAPENKIAPFANLQRTTTTSRIVNTSAVVERLPVGVLVCSLLDTGIIETLFINKFARDVFDLDAGFSAPFPLADIWAHDENHILNSQVLDVFCNQRQSHFEWSIRTGVVERHLSSQLIPLVDHTGKVYQVVCTVEDQTAEKMAEKNLLHHAFHDALTGLPNRVLFRSRLEESVADSQRAGFTHGCAVLIINIDRFQQINESFGHSSGDRFLVAMSATLRRCIRASDTLARLSGDEFAVLVTKCRDLEEIQMISDRIHAAMRLPYDLDGNEVFTSVSVGVATTLASSAHPEDLIRDADFAMHRAKSGGKARTEVYHREAHQQARSQFHLETELRRAVERGDMELHYQPIIEIETGKLKAFEGLARWIHKEKGFISPAEFIPLAEETGIIVDLGRWAIMTACAQVRHWIDTYGEDSAVPINVNVSAIQFGRDDVVGFIRSSLEEFEVPGKLLRIEITESTFMANPSSIADTLRELQSLGVKVALDDFGTGYSSLNYLHQFPIDIIKIDRSFINQLEQDNHPYKILQMIAALAESLNYEMVAEGLEDLTHVGMLQRLNFRYGQGFYYSRPVTAEKTNPIIEGNLPWLAGKSAV